MREADVVTEFDQEMDAGQKLEEADELVAALRHYVRARTLRPTDPRAALATGRLALAFGRPAQAIEDLTHCLLGDQDHVEALVLRASAYLMAEQFRLALRDALRSLALTETVDAYLVCAQANLALGVSDDAKGAAESASSLDAEDPDAALVLVEVYTKLAHREEGSVPPNDILNALKRARKLWAGDPIEGLLHAEALWRQGDEFATVLADALAREPALADEDWAFVLVQT